MPYKNVNLIFCTLWGNISPQNYWVVQQSVSDFSLIKTQGRKITPTDFNTLHQTDYAFLKMALSLSDAKTNIVITHHVPTFFNYPEQYKNSKSATINHFYEKLLLLKDMINTDTAKRIAEQRHEVMVQYLSQFMDEWEGKDVG